MNNLAALLKAKPQVKPRSSAQQIQSKLFQQSGQLARLRMNAMQFSKSLYGQDLAIAQKFVDLVWEAEKKNKKEMSAIPKTRSLPY